LIWISTWILIWKLMSVRR